jgi:hypothetical protein
MFVNEVLKRYITGGHQSPVPTNFWCSEMAFQPSSFSTPVSQAGNNTIESNLLCMKMFVHEVLKRS